MEHVAQLMGNPKPLYRTLVICLTTRTVKAKCKPILHRMFSSLQGTQIATALLDEFTNLLISNKFQVSFFYIQYIYI